MTTIAPLGGTAVRPPGTDRRAPIAALAAGAATFVAYLPGLGRSLDFDSAETVGRFVRPGPPWAVFREQAVFNNHPLFSFLEQLVRVVTGRSDAAAMRLLPILCGALAVGVLTWFVVRRHGLAAGLAAGAVLACNPTFVHLSRAVRGYSLLTLCAIVATVVVAEDRAAAGPRRRWTGPLYVAAATIGVATHLYMVPVIAAHLGAVLARGQLDDRWRRRFLGTAALAGCAYVGMADVMLHATSSHARVFKGGMPWRVAAMATGGGWASVALAPLVAVGAVIVLRGSRTTRGAALGLAVVLVGLWAGLQSAALEDRFFVWLVPGVAYLVGVAVGRIRVGAVVAAGSAVLALTAVIPGYTEELTGYRAAAAVVRSVDAAGGRACIVGSTGVVPMLAYLDPSRDFTAVTDPSGLDRCDVVVVAAWWPTNASWFSQDRQVIDAAETRFPYRVVLPASDPALVLSNRPLAALRP
ncbi:MAG: Dolichyl-phosphate-mannose-protein mannosyltransferase [Actinomycetota bacterium]|nr:Dolichyl-phosphate-mannose-protein mannosyltransferase [Actinomycetota bacterium]